MNFELKTSQHFFLVRSFAKVSIDAVSGKIYLLLPYHLMLNVGQIFGSNFISDLFLLYPPQPMFFAPEIGAIFMGPSISDALLYLALIYS